jgi:addiction module HigA family antidote
MMSTIIDEERTMAMHDPPHPGGILRRQCLEPLGLSVTRAAEGLGVTRQALSDLVNGKAGVSMEMAIRLSKAFGSTPETWLGIQMAYDLWQARARAEEIMVEKFEPAEAAR